jgi:two-component system, response regulator
MLSDGVDILLVEDNANDEMLALHAFKKQNLANTIHVVRDGAEALDYLFRTGAYVNRAIENPKLILLDLKLPLVDGFEVLRQIRANPRTCLVPVVVLTASSEERDIVETYKSGVNSYVVKPVDFGQFNDFAKVLKEFWLLINRQPSAVLESRPEPISRPVSA